MPHDDPTSCPMLRALRSLRDFYDEQGCPEVFDEEMRRHLSELETLVA